jgi:glycosyltransferase involved in cell wall biosynthesis
MKIAYISSTPFSDVDISYISEAQKIMDIDYYIQITPSTKQRAAIDFSRLSLPYGVYKASGIEEMQKFTSLLNLDKVFIVNFTYPSAHHISAFHESYKFYRYIAKLNYSVIHLTWPPRYSGFFILKLQKKIVLTVHDPFSHSSERTNINELERKFAFYHVNHFIVLNRAQKEDFIKIYKLENKKVYDSQLSRFDYLQIYSNPSINERNSIIFFGSIQSHKGLNYLFSAMEKVHEVLPDVKLIVAGKGDFYFDIERYKSMSYFDISNRFIPDDELAILIQESKLVVVPYIDATQSGVVMTAYAFNKPCVATKVGGLPEMVIENQLGSLVPPHNDQALADAIISLLQNDIRRKTYSINIEKEYMLGSKSWNSIAKKLKDIYSTI